jgi:hypothetical protein
MTSLAAATPTHGGSDEWLPNTHRRPPVTATACSPKWASVAGSS